MQINPIKMQFGMNSSCFMKIYRPIKNKTRPKSGLVLMVYNNCLNHSLMNLPVDFIFPETNSTK